MVPVLQGILPFLLHHGPSSGALKYATPKITKDVGLGEEEEMSIEEGAEEVDDEKMPLFKDEKFKFESTFEAVYSDGFLLDATLTPPQLLDVVRMNEVFFVDCWLPPRTYMDNVRADGGADEVEALVGYSGKGVRAEVRDSGLLTLRRGIMLFGSGARQRVLARHLPPRPFGLLYASLRQAVMVRVQASLWSA